VASREPTPFERIFPRGEFFRGRARRACLWSVLGSLLLCLVLLIATLVVELLSTGGTVKVAGAERQELRTLLGEESPVTEIAAGSPSDVLIYENRGLLPVVWEQRSRPWGGVLAGMYRVAPLLRNDSQALAILVLVGALLTLLWTMAESRARTVRLQVVLASSTNLRRSIHRQTLRLGPSDLEGREIGQAYQLFTGDVDAWQRGLFLWLDRLGRDPFRLALMLLLTICVHWLLALLCLIPLGFCWFISRRELNQADEARQVSEARSSRELKLLAEGLAKTRLVRGFGMEAFEQEQFQKYLHRYQEDTVAAVNIKRWTRRAVRTLVTICVGLTVYLVGSKILPPMNELSFAGGWLLLSSLALSFSPLQNLGRLTSERQPADLAAARIQSYLNRIPEVGQAVGAKFLQPLSRMLEFHQICYSTGSRRMLLDGFSLKVPAGRQIAIVSTDPLESQAVGYMLPRFIEPQAGKILIDGEDISWVTLESLRAEVLFVGGKDPFLTGTVRDNLAGGNPSYSLQDVTDAAKMAHAHSFILKLPQGFETVIGEHGEQLDVGQGFRLGLARAALRKPALLIIEEPTESLDEDTKSLLEDAYKRLAEKRTVIFLASRLSTLRRVDEIVFMHRGRVEAVGSHARLVQISPLYRHWEYVKFNEFRHEFEHGGQQ